MAYDASQLTLPSDADLDEEDLMVMKDEIAVRRIAGANELKETKLSEMEIRQLMEFLHCLTDPAHLDMRRIVPKTVLSGISVFD